jgi:O-antigen/teichoic acid export membrane protein
MASPEHPTPDPSPWYLRPGLSRRIVVTLAVALALLFLLDLALALSGGGKKPYFPWEKWPGLNAIFGFVACTLLVLTARFVLRPLVKRDEAYYESPTNEEGGKNDA